MLQNPKWWLVFRTGQEGTITTSQKRNKQKQKRLQKAPRLLFWSYRLASLSGFSQYMVAYLETQMPATHATHKYQWRKTMLWTLLQLNKFFSRAHQSSGMQTKLLERTKIAHFSELSLTAIYVKKWANLFPNCARLNSASQNKCKTKSTSTHFIHLHWGLSTLCIYVQNWRFLFSNQKIKIPWTSKYTVVFSPNNEDVFTFKHVSDRISRTRTQRY